MMESDYVAQQSKQRASMKWLLAKAYNNKVPSELREPFYQDHNEVEHLKPHIVHSLANAELFCMALSNLYADPNYNNLNHWGIIQALARKGIYVAEPPDCALTETVLIQTTPLKVSAHLAVTEALMALYIKETVNAAKVFDAIHRLENAFNFEKKSDVEPESCDKEDVMLFWTNSCCKALKSKILDELGGEQNQETPLNLPVIQDLSNLADGVAIASIVSLYCPEDVNWKEIALGDPPSMADSLLNIELFQRFLAESSASNMCHLTAEDFVYFHASIKQNLVSFLADLFWVLEIQKIRPNNIPGQRLENSSSTQSTGKNISKTVGSKTSPTGASTKDDEGFLVQRGRTVPTLSMVGRITPSPQLLRGKEHLNTDTKSEERGETEVAAHAGGDLDDDQNVFEQMKNIPVAGRPTEISSPSSNRRSSSALGGAITGGGGRRSRRNSVDENFSQLSIENLCGSQKNVHLLGRNPDKEMRVHVGRAQMSTSPGAGELSDNSPDNRDFENVSEKHTRETAGKPDVKVSFADLRKQKAHDNFHSSGININYMQNDKEETNNSVVLNHKPSNKDERKEKTRNGDGTSPDMMATQLNTVRMKLEQRRRRIEEEKKKMESIMAKQREKVGQEAFLRAVGVKAHSTTEKKGNQGMVQRKLSFTEKRPSVETSRKAGLSELSLKDLSNDLSAVQSRWLSERNSSSSSSANQGFLDANVKTPDIEAMDIETYSQNLHAMNDSLHDLQSDIQRLSQQQSQIQQMMHHQRPPAHSTPSVPSSSAMGSVMDPQPFYISHDSQSAAAAMAQQVANQRRTWGQPQPIHFAHQDAHGWPSQRQQWGVVGRTQSQFHPQPSPNDHYSYQQQNPMYGGSPLNQAFPSSSPYNTPQNPLPQQHPGLSLNAGGYGSSAYNSYGVSSPAPINQTLSSGPQQKSPFRLQNLSANDIPSTELLQTDRLSQVPNAGSLARNEKIAGKSLEQSNSSSALSRQNSRESYGTSAPKHDLIFMQPSASTALNSTTPERRLHSGLPAPQADDMAPQSVSFIEDSSHEDDAETEQAITDNGDLLRKLPERLSQLNISSGSKTYRVHSDKETSPSPTRTSRPTISSTFKQNRRNSGENNGGGGGTISGPSSLQPPSLTEEEAETLAMMKTERLKDDADAAKGFVISFDDELPKKPKPQLKPRRPSMKKNSAAGFPSNEFSSDGSNSSRKENVPPEVMICIDMNMGSNEDDGSPVSSLRKSSPTQTSGSGSQRSGLHRNSTTGSGDPANWKSYSNDGHSLEHNSGKVIPQFNVDPNVPLESLATLGPGRGAGGSESDSDPGKGTGLIIGEDLLRIDPNAIDEMQRKKERIMMQSLRRKQQAEENRIKAEEEARRRRLEEQEKEEDKLRKKEEEKMRRNFILEQHRLKKDMERAEEEGRHMPKPVNARPVPKLRSSSTTGRPTRPRPKTIHVDQDANISSSLAASRGAARGSSSNISGRLSRSESRNSISDLRDSNHRGGGGTGFSLSSMGSRTPGSSRPLTGSSSSRPTSRPSSRGPSRRGSSLYLNEESSNGPGSLPGYRRRAEFDDGASDISSTSGFSAYGHNRSGTRLYREPATKSNRTIILNAIEFVVFPGVVNRDTRERVLDVIDRCDCSHFLLLFRDQKCQFRGLYAYYPDTEEVYKIYGTGPKQVTEKMFDTFFKYNSGGKKFTKIHTKHLTVTIDAFTIHNNLWLGKKSKLPDKRDLALVI